MTSTPTISNIINEINFSFKAPMFKIVSKDQRAGDQLQSCCHWLIHFSSPPMRRLYFFPNPFNWSSNTAFCQYLSSRHKIRIRKQCLGQSSIKCGVGSPRKFAISSKSEGCSTFALQYSLSSVTLLNNTSSYHCIAK